MNKVEVREEFQHTAARRRLALFEDFTSGDAEFQHTAARRRLGYYLYTTSKYTMFQHTAARRRLGGISTPKNKLQRFNTQPPEGGWLPKSKPK